MAKKPNTAERFKHPENIVWRKVGSELILLDLDTSEYYTLNESGIIIWERICAGDDLEKVGAAICDEYAVEPKKAEADMRKVVDQLVKKKLLVPAKG